MKSYAPQKIKGPTELKNRIEKDVIYISVICPEAQTCLHKDEMKCKYETGLEKKYDVSKFPMDDAFITPLGCGEKFTIWRNKTGVYIELGDTKNI